tara:strand:+ start:954 stop:1994 length:1041 start_codon:yes stop_codon:yes gene_type:complete
MKTNIRELKLSQLEEILIKLQEPRYRSNQIYRWLWKEKVQSFEQMTNISKSCRAYLTKNFTIDYVKKKTRIVSKDGTIKFLFKLSDGNNCEGVLIPEKNRITACVSSQVGCSFSCKFCATGQMKRKRNILSYEIYDQVSLMMDEAKNEYKIDLTNIVYMGMGEPLVNYQNVVDSIKYITSKEGLNMSSKRITLSTVGVSKMIKKLADEDLKINLAVSLHSANNFKRSEIMDINSINDLDNLKDALIYFFDKTKTKITYEYVMLKDFNDTKKDALDLVKFSKIVPSKVNLIEFNSVEKSNFQKSTNETTKEFISILKKENIIVNLRRSRGEDVNAACGQLANSIDIC